MEKIIQKTTDLALEAVRPSVAIYFRGRAKRKTRIVQNDGICFGEQKLIGVCRIRTYDSAETS